MDNHTQEVCRKRKQTENDTNNGNTNTSTNNNHTCYHWVLPGHFKADSNHFQHVWIECTKLNKVTASLTTARDRDIIWLANNAHRPTAVSTPAAWVIYLAASHHMCNEHTRYNLTKNLQQPIFIELGDETKLQLATMDLLRFHWSTKSMLFTLL